MALTAEAARYLANMNDELNSSLLYRTASECEKDPHIAEFYGRLATVEHGHAELWAQRLMAAGAPVPAFRPRWRTHALAWMVRRFGVQTALPAFTSMEQSGSAGYAAQPEAVDMAGTERSHARLLQQISQTTTGGVEGGVLARFEGRHKSAGGNAVRAAVLGASDGLLSNFNLIMGVAGAQLSAKAVLLTGIAGLLAGAISMALGEWISVQSSRELYQKQIRTEKGEIAADSQEELEELVLIYQARGLSESAARTLASQIMTDKESAVEVHAREELGIDTRELGGSAWEAAITSFLLFALGAIIPVIPFMFLGGMTAVATSLALSLAGLFVIGAFITLFTGRSVWYSGMRQVLFGLIAAVATFSIGRLVGVTLGG